MDKATVFQKYLRPAVTYQYPNECWLRHSELCQWGFCFHDKEYVGEYEHLDTFWLAQNQLCTPNFLSCRGPWENCLAWCLYEWSFCYGCIQFCWSARKILSWVYLAKVKNFKDEKEIIATKTLPKVMVTWMALQRLVPALQSHFTAWQNFSLNLVAACSTLQHSCP